MSVNTAPHLMADLERLRAHLGIERWLVWGVSFGSALGLRYAQTHPGVVSELVLTGVATGSPAEVDLLTRGLGRIFPEAYERFLAELPEDERDGNLAAAYNRLLESPDPEVRARAARAWTDWETAIMPALPGSVERFRDPEFRHGFARTVTHYWGNDHFFGDFPGDGERRASSCATPASSRTSPAPWSRAASTSATSSASSGGCTTPGRAASW